MVERDVIAWGPFRNHLCRRAAGLAGNGYENTRICLPGL